jgi:PAS domain S-box-containing protein
LQTRTPAALALGDLLWDHRTGAMAKRQRQPNEPLLEAERDFRKVIESIPDGVAIHRQGWLVWANQSLADALLYATPDELVGRYFLDFVHPMDRERVEGFLGRLDELGELPPAGVRLLLRADGSELLVEVVPAQLGHFEGKPANLVVVRDITERRRFHDQMMLTDRLASVGTMAAGVAHEINNPLAYAMLSLEIAQRELSALSGPPESQRRVREAVEAAEQGLGRVRDVVKDVRSLAQADHEGIAPVDVRELLEEVLRLAGKEIRSKARLVRDYQRGSVSVAGARRQRDSRRDLLRAARPSHRGGERHGRRHLGRGAAAHLRPFFHHQARPGGHGARALGVSPHHCALRW